MHAEPRSISGLRTLSGTQDKQYPITTKGDNGGPYKNMTTLNSKNGTVMDNIEQMLGERRAGHGGIQSTRSTKLSGVTKARRIPGANKVVEVENMPSDISDDEWGEIQKFGQRLHEEQMRKQKADH